MRTHFTDCARRNLRGRCASSQREAIHAGKLDALDHRREELLASLEALDLRLGREHQTLDVDEKSMAAVALADRCGRRGFQCRGELGLLVSFDQIRRVEHRRQTFFEIVEAEAARRRRGASAAAGAKVENVLKGSKVPATITVYYFTWAGGFDGPRPLGMWDVGGRRIFFLRTDSGVLRTTCDRWDGCTEGVWSGAHPDYRHDPQKPIEYSLADLHLTRGENTLNKLRFAAEVDREEPDLPGLQEYAIAKLRHLALTETDEIKIR